MNISNVNKILSTYNENISKLVNLEETKEVLDILYKSKIIKMNKEGKIIKSNKEKVYVGKLQKKEHFGFVVVDGIGDFYVKNINKYMDGDYVIIILTHIEGKSQTANIVDLLKRENDSLILKCVSRGKFTKINDETLLSINIQGLDCEQIKPGTILSVKVKKIMNNKVIAQLNDIIADESDPDLEMKVVLYKYNIEVEFSGKVKKELEEIDENISKEEIEKRTDLRNISFFTIDGDDSKDLDDAVSLIKDNNSYTLYVSIADVTHYIKEGSNLDKEARERSTSVYFIDRVVPMLPKKISNGICSLHAGVDRLTMTCQIKFSLQGDIQDIKVYKSIINSKHRMTYKDVNDMLIRNDSDLIYKYSDIYSILKEMNKLAKILNKKRIDRGSFNLEDSDAKFKVDEKQNIIDIYPYIREDAEKLIEEFMIVANESVTLYANEHNIPFIYRIHGQPNPNKLNELKKMLLYLDIKVNLDYDNLNPQDFKVILDSTKSEIIKRTLSKMIVRSMQKAIYSPNNIGHFGLASYNYTHFTSPIRRYPDLEVHRLLKTIIEKKENIKSSTLETIAEHASEKEVKAMKAEYEIEDRKKAEYMQKYIGEVFSATITSVEDYGFFVELENTIRGLVAFRDLEEYKDNTPYLINFHNESTLKVGDALEVLVIGVNIIRGLVDFIPKDYKRKQRALEQKKSSSRNYKYKSKNKKKRNDGNKKNRKHVKNKKEDQKKKKRKRKN